MLKNRKKKGFTLIELVIVIAIIGILVAIAVPRFADATQGAKNRSIDSSARAIAGAISQYYATNLNWPASNAVGQAPAANSDAEKVYKAAGIKSGDMNKWSFSAGGTTTQVEVTYKWTADADKYTGSIPGVTTVTPAGSGSTGGQVTYKF